MYHSVTKKTDLSKVVHGENIVQYPVWPREGDNVENKNVEKKGNKDWKHFEWAVSGLISVQ